MILNLICSILPTWQIWPSSLLTGLQYFVIQIAKLNFIFPIDTLFICLLSLLYFEVGFFTAKMVMKVVNFFRGTGSGLDL